MTRRAVIRRPIWLSNAAESVPPKRKPPYPDAVFTIEAASGRLIEVRMSSPLTAADVPNVIQQIRLAVLSCSERVVMCGDLTRMLVMPPEYAEQFTAMFTRDNPKVERSAFLVAAKRSSFTMQLERMVREAKNPARKVFDDKNELLAYLEPALTPTEVKRLRALIDSAASA